MYDALDFIKLIGCILLAFFLVVALMMYGVTYGLSKPSCYAQWADSGMQAQWSFFGGCRLKQPNGAWITDEAYVELNKNVNISTTSNPRKEPKP